MGTYAITICLMMHTSFPQLVSRGETGTGVVDLPQNLSAGRFSMRWLFFPVNQTDAPFVDRATGKINDYDLPTLALAFVPYYRPVRKDRGIGWRRQLCWVSAPVLQDLAPLVKPLPDSTQLGFCFLVCFGQ